MKYRDLALVALFALASAGASAMEAEERVNTQCATCHGAQGQAASPIFPSLAGQNREYLAKQLQDFKAGRRKSETMGPQVVGLTNEEIMALAAWFSERPAKQHRVSDEDLLAVGRYIYRKGNSWSGVPACADCHGADAHGTTTLPRLAGQNSRYLLMQLKEFNQRTRTNDNAVMHLVASRLSEMEAKAVADFLSQLP
ncbi:MAG: c-type cytochrome [Rhodocyclaceae bacterium]